MFAITFGAQLITLVTCSTNATSHVVAVARVIHRIHLRLSSLAASLQIAIRFIFMLGEIVVLPDMDALVMVGVCKPQRVAIEGDGVGGQSS